jgi:hypothetical protein
MKVLKWWSALIVTFGFLGASFEALETEEFAIFFALLIMFAPVVYYLWRLVAKGDVQQG